MGRAGRLALAGGIVAAVAVIVAVALVSRGGGPRPATTTTGPGAATAPAQEPEPLPPADFPGAPPPDATVRVVRGPDGAPTEARYFDDAGRLTVVIAALRAARGPAASRTGAVVRCGSSARADAGYRWTRFPVRWRLSRAGSPPGVRRAAALAAMRRARGIWNATRSHCRKLPDRSRARFSYAGATSRRVAMDGVSTVDVGDVAALGGACPGAVACTITWVVGGRRAVESDTRISSRDAGGFSAGGRPGPRRLDLQAVMVHESGHTLGFGHVSARDVVMHPFVRRGGVTGRRLGRGDAVASNRAY